MVLTIWQLSFVTFRRFLAWGCALRWVAYDNALNKYTS